MVLAAICRTIHHILLDVGSINLRKQLHTGVSYSKQGGGVTDVTCQSSIQIVVEWLVSNLINRYDQFLSTIEMINMLYGESLMWSNKVQ